MKSISAVKIICWLIGLSIGGVVLLLIAGYVYFSVVGSRQVACMNNIRNVALGSMQHDAAKQRLPGWVNVVCPDPGTGFAGQGSKPGSWAFELLPYLEMGDLYYLYGPNNTDQGKDTRRCMANGLPQERIELLICPADEVGADTGMSIVANCGMRDQGWDALAIGRPEDAGGKYDDDYLEPAANGVFHKAYMRGTADVGIPRMTISSLAYIQAGDGSAATLMYSENVDATYWPGGTIPKKLDGTDSAVCFCWSGADPKRAATDPANAMKPGAAAQQQSLRRRECRLLRRTRADDHAAN